MLRFLAGVGSALLLIAAGFFIWTGMAQDEDDPVPDAPRRRRPAPADAGDRPARPPSADERTREQRRFDRADRDNDGRITLEELLYPRRRAFQRLDTNRDGRLSLRGMGGAHRATKFAEADAQPRPAASTATEYADHRAAPRAQRRSRRDQRGLRLRPRLGTASFQRRATPPGPPSPGRCRAACGRPSSSGLRSAGTGRN